jgi:hypothetical protein
MRSNWLALALSEMSSCCTREGGAMMTAVTRVALAAVLWCVLLDGAGCSHPPAAPPPRFVHFESGLDRPKADDDYIEVGLVIAALREKPDLHVAVIGYASAEGDATSNKSLSLKRAERIHDDLVHANIAETRVTVAARGADKPAFSNDTEDGRAKNRRVELFFFYPDRGTLQTQYGIRIEIKTR